MQFVVKAFLASIILPIVVLLVVRNTVLAAPWPAAVAESYNAVLETYTLTIGTLYAVLLAFIVFVVWSRYNEAQAAVEQEANHVQDLFRISRVLSAPARGELANAIEYYLAMVTEAGWGAMARGESLQSVDRGLNRIWQPLAEYTPVAGRDQALYEAALEQFHRLNELRNERVHRGRTHLSRPMEGLILLGALLTVGSMALFRLDSAVPHLVMTLLLASMVFAVLFLIHQLDQPFDGLQQVSAAPLLLVLRMVRQPAQSSGGSP
jgi:large-conductance mechanosensitive channel